MEKQFPPNPMQLSIIQDMLSGLKGADQLSLSLKNAATEDIDGALELARKLITDNSKMAGIILGSELKKAITDYLNQKYLNNEKDNHDSE